MVRVISVNLNGIRSAIKKGFFSWLADQNADIVCMQEIKAQDRDIQLITHPDNYYAYFHFAEKKGYSGVGIYSKVKPASIVTGLGWNCADQEGRYIEAGFESFRVASIYLPSGSSGPLRQDVKFDFLKRYASHLKNPHPTAAILCGDFNIAHKEIDLKNWRGNKKNSGFLPEERAWMDNLFGELNFVDAFRVINQQPDEYTWWSNRGQARAKNVGWRIDYQVISKALEPAVKKVAIYRDEKFSDHAPLIVDYDLQI